MSNRYPWGSNQTPVRDAVNTGFNAGVLVFVGALVINVINRSLGVTITANSPKPPDKNEDLHSVVD